MSGTAEGGIAAAKTNKERYGESFYSKIGQQGGSKKVPKGFAVNRELASSAGKIGGLRSKRRKSNGQAN